MSTNRPQLIVVLHVLPDLSQNKVKTNDKSINTLLRELISVQHLEQSVDKFWLIKESGQVLHKF